MRITESKLRSIIRGVIAESNMEDKPLKYNGTEIGFYDGGDWFMYGEVDRFDENLKRKFENLDPGKMIEDLKRYHQDDSLDNSTKNLRISSVFKPFKDALLDNEFGMMCQFIRIFKVISLGDQGKKGWVCYDMPLSALIRPIDKIDQYIYLGKSSEKDEDESDPKFRMKNLFRHLKKARGLQNFQVLDRDLIKLCKKIGALKLIFMRKKMMNGYRSKEDINNILNKNDLIKSFLENQYEFDPDTQNWT